MPKPKVNKVLDYRKCQQCRKDRQKCTPEGRSWPGRRCDRCQRYDYACSANRTKNEETAPSSSQPFTQHDAESGARPPRYSPELRSLPQLDAEYEARCLQNLGDYHHMLTTTRKLKRLNLDFATLQTFNHCLETRICGLMNQCAEKITVQAQIHQAQGRYKDAEYLYRQLEASSAPLEPSYDILLKPELDMVLIYEKLGNLPAAETLQEYRLLFLMRPEFGSDDAIISRQAENLFRLYTLFLARVEDLNVMSSTVVLMTMFYRVAILGCSLLNALLFKSELWTRYNHKRCLHFAIGIQSTEMIRGLISIGVDVNKSGFGWSTPLLSAARYGNLDGLELLLHENADVGANHAGFGTVLHAAIYRDPEQKVEIIYRLIKAGVDVNAQDSRGHTALQSAVFHGPEPEAKVVSCLIEAGVNIEAEDHNKITALYLAVRRGYLTTVQLLLQQEANTAIYGAFEETPLAWAVRCIDKSMARLLLDYGANIKAKNRNGDTPLHLAVISRQTEMVGILLRGGASAAARNYSGETPVDIAKYYVRGKKMNGQVVLDMLLEDEN